MQEFTQKEPSFKKSPWLEEPLEIKWIYLKSKVIKQVVSAIWDTTIACGFPPKIVLASCRDSLEACNGSTDMTTSFTIRTYDDSWSVWTADYTNLVKLSTITWDIWELLHNWFVFSVSSFSGGSKNVYFTCFS